MLSSAGDIEAFFIHHGREDTMPAEQEFGFIEDSKIADSMIRF